MKRTIYSTMSGDGSASKFTADPDAIARIPMRDVSAPPDGHQVVSFMTSDVTITAYLNM